MSTTPTTTATSVAAPGVKVYSTDNPFEKRYGYVRAVRRGPLIAVSGTTSITNSGASASTSTCTSLDTDAISRATSTTATATTAVVQFSNDAGRQAALCLERATLALEALGGTASDITRIRWFVRRFADCDLVGAAMREFADRHAAGGNDVRGSSYASAATMVVLGEGGGFVMEGLMVELEVDAYISV